MNLIEQLGGYERAKNIRLGNEEDWMFYSIKKDWYSDIKHDDSFIFIDGLKYELIDHRRANNIFEVGDKVLHPMFSGIFTVDTIQSYSVLATLITGYHASLVISLITHATDEEIKAGRRL